MLICPPADAHLSKKTVTFVTFPLRALEAPKRARNESDKTAVTKVTTFWKQGSARRGGFQRTLESDKSDNFFKTAFILNPDVLNSGPCAASYPNAHLMLR